MSATPRVISAAHTALLKFGVPPLTLWQGVEVAVSWVRYRRLHDHPPSLSAAAVAVSLVAFPLAAWACARLKRVALTDDALFVSNFRREIAIPLRDVVRVKQRFVFRSAIVVDLARDHEFGARIEFIPKNAHRWFWTHPLVDQLRDAVAAAKKI